MSQHTVTTHRRNGKLQSCEPCRKRKLSCDHKLPSCGRCVKRGLAKDCHYHPAPMTRNGRSGPKSTSPQETPSTSAYSSITATQELSTAARTQQPSPSPMQRVNYEGAPQDGAEKVVISPLGFLGESSSSAVVAELIDSMGETQTEAVYAHAEDKITEAMVQRGAAILHHLKGLEDQLAAFQAWTHVEDGYLIFSQAYDVFLTGLWKYLGTTLQSIPPAQRLQHLSRLVWRNTYKPINVTSDTTIEEWANQATGENLRWETVGLLFSAVGLRTSGATYTEEYSHQDIRHPNGRTKTAKAMLRLEDECIDICRECGSCSDLLACLLYQRSPLVEWVRGDVSAEAWARFGEVCNIAVELGLHKEKLVNARTPFFLCELRIRLFEMIYVHDKYVSTYLGRPPRISYRHCFIQLPTDLSDKEVCSSQAELVKTLANLNGGYATSGRLSRATVRRASTEHFIIREEILEIVLGNPQEDVSIRIHQIRGKIAQSTEQMPPFIRLDPEELLTNVSAGRVFEISGRKVMWQPMDVVLVLKLHCNLRHTDFLLERALVRRSKADPAKLIASARSLLNLVMKITSNSGLLQGFHLYKAELVSLSPHPQPTLLTQTPLQLAFYAIPCAAVLAIELLKHDQLGLEDPALPRSIIIQQLSVLVSALEGVLPDDGNKND
jgi:hypothetical protein